MKALTVKQPWAWAIMHGGKDVENRSRPTKHRGQLYIHAGKTHSQEGIDFLRARGQWPAPTAGTLGMVIGTVDVIDCHHADACWTGSVDKDDNVHEEHCSDWAMEGHYHWVLANPRPLATPFPMQGKLGIWNFGEES